MRTRSRTASQSVAADENEDVQIKIKKKAPQTQNAVDLVASIIGSIKEEKSTQKSNELNDKNSNPNAGKTLVRKHVTQSVRGKPKSGRPWKEVKQR